MKHLFVPYNGEIPAPLSINGHRLILTTREPEHLESQLAKIGADHLLEVLSATEQEEQRQIQQIAVSCDSGIVILPEQYQLDDVIKTLEHDLPWVH